MTRAILNLAALAATILINFLANALPLNGKTTGEISDSFAVFFVPAGYAFSIWGLIYLGLLAYAVYQLLAPQRDDPYLRSIDSLFLISCAANSVWLFLWHYELFVLTLLAMIILLLSLIAIYLRLDISRAPVSGTFKWLVHRPFSIYLGWVTVATIVNVTVVLADLNWSGWGISPEVWTVVVLFTGAAIAGLVLYRRGDLAYGLVILWAYIAVAVKNSGVPLVGTVAMIASVLVAVLLLATLLRFRIAKA